MRSAPSPSPRSTVAWLVPLLAALFPAFGFFWCARLMGDDPRADREEAWMRRTDGVARRLEPLSRPEFWFEESLRRLRHRIARQVARGRDVPTAVTASLRRPLLRRPLPLSVWAFAFPGGDLDAAPVMITGTAPGEVRLESTNRSVFGRLLVQTARRHAGLPSELGGKEWNRRLDGIFGHAITTATFRPSRMGKAFPTIFGREFQFAAWTILEADGRPVGALLAVTPNRPDRDVLAARQILANWDRRDVRPFFLEYPVTPTATGANRHEAGSAHEPPRTAARVPRSTHRQRAARVPGARHAARPVARLLRRVQDRLWLRPPDGVVDCLGRLRLPVEWMGAAIREGDWLGRVCPLDPSSRHLALLVGRSPPRPPNAAGLPAWAAGTAWVLGWLLLLSHRLLFGAFPSLGVRGNLLAALMALIALPLGFALSGGVRSLADRRENLRFAWQSGVQESLWRIDQESGRLLLHQRQVIRSICEDPAVVHRLQEIQRAGGSPAAFLGEMLEWVRQRGVPAEGVVVFGHRGFSGSCQKGTFPPELWDFGTYVVDEAIGRQMGGLPLPPGAEDLPLAKPVPRKGETVRKVIRAAMAPLRPGRITRLWLGGKHLLTSDFGILRANGEPWYLLAFVWDQRVAFRDFLRDTLARRPLPPGWLHRAAFAVEGDPEAAPGGGPGSGPAPLDDAGEGPELLACTSETRDRTRPPPAFLAGLAANGRNGIWWATSREGGEECLDLAVPCVAMPGMVLAARTSLASINRQIRREGAFLAGVLGLALSLPVFVAWILSRQMADPVRRLAAALQEVTAGNLGIRIAEDRPDELGQAGAELDRMVGHLRERHVLGRFVAPEVRDLVGGGNWQAALQGSVRHAAVLTADIRSFTTITESRPPEEVFQALEDHFTVLAPVVRAHGGTIDRFSGDALTAVFYGPPATAARRAMQAGVGLMRAHHDHQGARARAGSWPFAIGVGIDAGPVVTGIVGDAQVRLDHTVMGEPVARAAALEAASKAGSATRVVVSNRVRQDASAHGEVVPVAGPVDAWEVVSLADSPGSLPPSSSQTGPATLSADGPTPPAVSPDSALPSMAHRLATPSPTMPPAPPAVPPAGDPPGSAHAPTAGGDTGTPLSTLLLIGWLTGAFLLAASWWILENGVTERATARTRLLLDQDLTLMETLLTPELAIRAHLNDHLASATRAGADGLAALPGLLAGLEPDLPGSSWAVLRFRPLATTSRAVFDNLSASHAGPDGASHPIDPATVRALDIGGHTPPGSWTISGPNLLMDTAGQGFGGTDDSVFLLAVPGETGTEVTVRVREVGESNLRAAAGLMVRQGLAADSPMVFFGCQPRQRLTTWYRAPDWPIPVVLRADDLPGPLWLKARLHPGAVETAFSSDGHTWNGAEVLPLPASGPRWIGLAGTAQATGVDNRAEMAVVVASGGLPLPCSTAALPRLGIATRMIFLRSLTEAADTRGHLELENAWDAEKPGFSLSREDEILRATTLSSRIPMFGGERDWFVLPVLTPGHAPAEGGVRLPVEVATAEAQRPSRLGRNLDVRYLADGLTGLAMLWLPPGTTTASTAAALLPRLLHRRGIRGGALPLQADCPFPAFFTPGLSLTSLLTGATGEDGTGEGLLEGSRILPGGDSRLVAFRPLDSAGAGAGRARLALAFFLVWLAVGLGSLVTGPSGVGILRRSLGLQLVAGFAAAVVPILVLTVALLGRMGEEYSTLLETESRRGLEQRLRQIDESARLFAVWLPQATRRAARETARWLSHAADLGPAAVRRHLEGIYSRLYRCAAPIKSVNFLDPASHQGSFPPRESIAKHDITDALQVNALRQNIRRLEGKAFFGAAEGNDRPEDLLIGSELEDGRVIIAQTIGEEANLRLGLDLECIVTIKIGTNRQETYHSRYLRAADRLEVGRAPLSPRGVEQNAGFAPRQGADRPAAGRAPSAPRLAGPTARHASGQEADRRMALLQFRCSYPFRTHLLGCWEQALAGSADEPLALAFSDGSLTGLRFLPAGDRFPPKMGLRYNVTQDSPQRWLLPPGPAWLALRAAYTNQPLWELAGEGPGEALRMAYPSRQGTDLLLLGEIGLGAQRGTRQTAIRSQEGLLLAILVLTLILAGLAARGFIEPLRTLRAMAARIGEGDFSARFPPGYRDEFAVLAGAFDHMAEAGEEGRLLGRFVSADVREVARTAGERPDGPRAERREAVILFAGLGGFKERLATRDPRNLVAMLNRHLETMSRIIRTHGGEIDKFVGDRILAVFRPPPGQEAVLALPGPARCAREMRAAMTETGLSRDHTGRQGGGSDLPSVGTGCRLGVGLVAGQVLAGILGSAEVRQEFTVIGDPVNLASRLADLAAARPDGGVVLDGALAARVAAHATAWDLPVPRLLETRTVKGKTRAVEIHLLPD
ncbi:MAG: HAMP domain-containing protein [Candidatus Riflebacteria bacterium]|nr:HAMP domain-containing protein [Candidatus Riflebacteria bacterium]